MSVDTSAMEIFLTLPIPFTRYVKNHKKEYPEISEVFSDPENHKLGSAGGSVYVLWQAYTKYKVKTGQNVSLKNWLSQDKRMIIHSDGQSRRLPAYAGVGKSFIPFPVFKWGRGQRIRQTLFDIQKPFLKRVLENAPPGMNTLIASGDALIYSDSIIEEIPQADIVCIGAWTQPEIATSHGVFFCSRHNPSSLEFMLQKPSLETLQHYSSDFLYLLDAGIWLLSDHAVEVLFSVSGWRGKDEAFQTGLPSFVDLYSDIGPGLGNKPVNSTYSSVKKLKTSILTLENADFYHFGSKQDLIRSCSLLQNRIIDQREIWHKKIKPSSDLFILNSITKINLSDDNKCIWIENSFIPETWKISRYHYLTGIIRNQWNLEVPEAICLDFVPVGNSQWCIRFYGYDDTFKGIVSDASTTLMNIPVLSWFEQRNIEKEKVNNNSYLDIYDLKLFPVIDELEITEHFLHWIFGAKRGNAEDGENSRNTYIKAEKLSCSDIIRKVNHHRIFSQKDDYMRSSLPAMAKNFRQSIFYQLDLKNLVDEYERLSLSLPEELPGDVTVMNRIHDNMFRAVYFGHMNKGKSSAQGVFYENQAFSLLKKGMIEAIQSQKQAPSLNIQSDQILWARSPVRLDLAGGWTDTPPYCILFGGSVMNMAVDLNKQPPLQVFIRPSHKNEIIIRSIDLGVSEIIKTFDQINIYNKVGSAFSIPKAALMLSGFHPEFSSFRYASLQKQLMAFGGGFEISLVVAVPKGSGLGTSSILAATLLGALSDFCNLGWDNYMLAYRTLILEQMLTTGGGWQDQYGGIFEGVKLIESNPGFIQKPSIKWAPEYLFTQPYSKGLILLYYTGINRIARNILQEIVKGMFLNSSAPLEILSEMKAHAVSTYEAVQLQDLSRLAKAIEHTWDLNRKLNKATSTPEITFLLSKIKDYALSYKLLGAGGGGYLMIFAKDDKAVGKIKEILLQYAPNPAARFVDWNLSHTGFQISRS